MEPSWASHEVEIPSVEQVADPAVERVRCEDAAEPLAALPDHVYSLYAIASENDVYPVRPGGIADWLILAAGLDQVSIHTNGLGPGDDFCSNIYEEIRGAAAGAAATELTRLLFLWGAAQGLVRVKWGRKNEQGQPRRMAQLVGERSPMLLHHGCFARNLLAGLDRHRGQGEYGLVLQKAQRLDAGEIGQATFAAYQLRNALAHGAVPWPDDDSVPSGPTVFLAGTACRLLAFTVQWLLMEVVPPSTEVVDFRDDDSRHVPIGEVLPRLHLRL